MPAWEPGLPCLSTYPVADGQIIDLNKKRLSLSETTERDRGLLSLIDRLVKRPGGSAATKPFEPVKFDTLKKGAASDKASVADDGAKEGLDPIVPEEKAPASLEPQLAVESTREVTRTELAELIIKALQAGEKYPTSGFEVSVYGSRPWNAMLRILPAAGAVNAAVWRDRLQTVVLLFRDRYEIKEDADA